MYFSITSSNNTSEYKLHMQIISTSADTSNYLKECPELVWMFEFIACNKLDMGLVSCSHLLLPLLWLPYVDPRTQKLDRIIAPLVRVLPPMTHTRQVLEKECGVISIIDTVTENTKIMIARNMTTYFVSPVKKPSLKSTATWSFGQLTSTAKYTEHWNVLLPTQSLL